MITRSLLRVTHHAMYLWRSVYAWLCGVAANFIINLMDATAHNILHILFLMISPVFTYFFFPKRYHFTSVFYKLP